MVSKKELKEQIAARLQARMSWPKAEACAVDIVHLFDYKGWTVVELEE